MRTGTASRVVYYTAWTVIMIGSWFAALATLAKVMSTDEFASVSTSAAFWMGVGATVELLLFLVALFQLFNGPKSDRP